MLRRAAAVLFLLLLPASGVIDAAAKVRVATRVVRPFVFQEGGDLTGFSIELWREISRRIGVESEFLVEPTVQDLLDRVKSGQAAVGIAAISITSEREEEFDLSQPM